MKNLKILTIVVKDRIKEAGRTQRLLTEYAHIIKSRLGFHEVSSEICSRVGVIILQISGNPSDWNIFIEKLSQIGGIEFKSMEFDI
ncbi:MAG: hypothetical protein KA792_04580 [Bacteroidales bacterium]|nr:hypothetical protein [Bacteroidales bacterium]